MRVLLACWSSATFMAALLVVARAGAQADAAGASEVPAQCDEEVPELQEIDASCTPRPPPASDQVPDVASLKALESPAFMALGVVPSQIQRPTTPMGLVTSLALGVAGGTSFGLPRNFALEVAPYWLARHPDVSFRAWQSQRGRAWYRNASLSLATAGEERKVTRDGVSETITYTSAAAGLRTSLWPGSPSSGAIRCRDFLERYAQERVIMASRRIAAALEDWEKEHPPPSLTAPPKPDPAQFLRPDGSHDAEALNRAFKTWNEQVNDPAYQARHFAAYRAWQEARSQASAQAIEDFDRDHPVDTEAIEGCLAGIHAVRGFVVDVAGAYAVKLPSADWSKLDEDGSTIGTGWLTAGYVAENLRKPASTKSALEGSIIAVFRAQGEKRYDAGAAADVRRLDGGLRLVLAARRLGSALEGTLRHQHTSAMGSSKDALLYRIAVSFDYRLSGGMWLTGTFGKDFGATAKRHPLIALANLQWAFDTTRGVSADSFKSIASGK